MFAWQRLLEEKLDEEDEERLRHHFHDDSQLVAFDMPDLTRAFLKLSGADFHNVLKSTPRSAIDDTDATGRTTLAWAARQGKEDAVKALLAYGADPNHRDTTGLTPLHMSSYADTPECLRLLLNAKADVDTRDDDGGTLLASLSEIMDKPDFSELLLSHGADIESTDSSDRTPLLLAAQNKHPSQVSLLLRKGANINASDSYGFTALDLAIIYNSPAVVKLLLNSPALNCERKLDDGSTAIHMAAQYANVGTLKILQAANLGNIDLDAMDARGNTALDDARWRRDNNEDWTNWSVEPRDEDPEAWYEAFKELINSIRVSQGKDVLGDSESECSTCLSETSVGDDLEGSGDEQDEQDEWYDTAEEGD